ncbi:hypothetical protein QCD79_34720, partial [Pseudomonas quasicaspiana]|nr:hypothetical protein [Pseudomonas quasicaspiana]
IGNLAFPGSAHLIDEVKVGVLMGSGLAAIAGVILLRSRMTPAIAASPEPINTPTFTSSIRCAEPGNARLP